jgi:hypothetical protein
MSFSFSEETVTETILLELGTRHSREITILPFNKREEGRTGADWEWCFYAPRHHVRMLVQAKVLDDEDRNYAHLDREIGSSGVLQIERLISNAQSLAIPAVYVFYNHLTDESRLPQLGKIPAPLWGVTVAFADTVRSLLPRKSFDAIGPVSLPWILLVCTGELDLPNRVVTVLRELRRVSREVDSKGIGDPTDSFRVPDPELVNGQPPYMSEVRDLAGTPPGPARQRFIDQLAMRFPGRDGLILIRDRTE